MEDFEEIQKKILIVAKKPDLAQIIVDELSDANYSCNVNFNYKDAFETFRVSTDFNLLISDFYLEDGTINDLLKVLATEEFQSIEGFHVIVISKENDVDSKVIEVDNLRCHFLKKPFSMEDLLQKVKDIIG